MAVFTAIGASIFGAGTFLAGLTAAGLQVTAGLVLSSIGRGASTGEPQPPKFGVQGRLQGGEEVPRSINLGWNCTAGSLVWHNTFGSGGTMSARVIAIGDMSIRELLYPIVEGVDCTLLKDQTHADYGWPVAEYRIGGVDHLWIKFYDGTQTTADPFLVSTFSSDPDRPYGATRIGHGVPYVIVFARAPERNDEGDKPLFQGLPAYKFVTNGARWYNPAKDTTVGGDGAQRWDTPSTWGNDAGDFNPIVQLYNVLRGVRYGGAWLYGMQGISAARLPVANWIAGINAAQAAIDGPGGSEPTYRAGGEVQVGAQVATTVEALLTAANARLVENGGIYTIYVGPPGEPVMAFTDADILSTEEQSFAPFLSLADTVNGIDASYPNPGEGWNTKKAPALLRPDLEPLAGNRRLLAKVSLDLVPYSGQVQRLMKWALSEALRARRHTFVLGPEFRVIEPGDVVQWTSARNGYVEKLFRVDGVIYKSNLDVIVDLTEVDPSDYDWNQGADYTPVIDGPLQLVGPRPMPMTGWQVFPWEWERRPSALVQFASGLPGVERVRVQVRSPDEDGALIFDSDNHPYAAPWSAVLQGSFAPNMPIAVRGIFVGPPAAEWSGWFQITTPNVKLTADDIDVTFEAIAAEISQDLKWISTGVRDAINNFERLGSLIAEQDLANFNDRETLRREIRKQAGDLEASFTEIIEVATGPAGAIGQVLQVLFAAMGGNSSQVNVRWEALAAPEGYSARYAITAAVDDGSYRSASFMLDVPADPDGPTRIVLDADQTVITSDGGATVAALFEAGTTTIRSARIGDASISTAKIVDAAINSAKIANAAVTTAKIADANITSAKIADANITSAKIDNAAITSAKIGDLQVSTIKIANNAITVAASDTVSNQAIPGSTGLTATIVFSSVPTGAIFQLSTSALITNAGGGANYTLTLYRNGTQLAADSRGNAPGETQNVALSVTKNDIVPSGGTITYTAVLRSPFTPSTFHVSNDFVLAGLFFQK